MEEEIKGAGFPFLNEDGCYLPMFDFRPQGLLLVGPSAIGKTTSAWAVVKKTFHFWDSSCSAPDLYCWRAAQLGREITAAASGRGDTGYDSDHTPMQILSRRLIRCGLLFLDDIDKTRFTPRVQAELFDVIEARESANLPILITTNCAGKELAGLFDKNIGWPIVNRLSRMCYMVDFSDRSFDYSEQLAAIQGDLISRAGEQSALTEERLKPRIEAKRIRDEAIRVAAEARRIDEALLEAAVVQGTADGLPDHLRAQFNQAAARNGFARMRARLALGPGSPAADAPPGIGSSTGGTVRVSKQAQAISSVRK